MKDETKSILRDWEKTASKNATIHESAARRQVYYRVLFLLFSGLISTSVSVISVTSGAQQEEESQRIIFYSIAALTGLNMIITTIEAEKSPKTKKEKHIVAANEYKDFARFIKGEINSKIAPSYERSLINWSRSTIGRIERGAPLTKDRHVIITDSINHIEEQEFEPIK